MLATKSDVLHQAMCDYIYNSTVYVLWFHAGGSRPWQVLGVQAVPNMFKTNMFHAFGEDIVAKDKHKSYDDAVPQANENQ